MYKHSAILAEASRADGPDGLFVVHCHARHSRSAHMIWRSLARACMVHALVSPCLAGRRFSFVIMIYVRLL